MGCLNSKDKNVTVVAGSFAQSQDPKFLAGIVKDEKSEANKASAKASKSEWSDTEEKNEAKTKDNDAKSGSEQK
jgi:hypothetical protein